MAGIGDGFTQGLSMGMQMRDAKKRREQEKELSAARDIIEREKMQRDIDKLREEHAARKALQGDQLAADAARMQRELDDRAAGRAHQSTEADRQRGWQSGENTAQRGWQSGERLGTQSFGAGEAEKQRAFQAEIEKARRALEGEKHAWDRDPANPSNIDRLAHADYLRSSGVPDLPVLPNSADALKNGTKGMQAAMPPAAAIDMLRKNPQLAREFEAKYGPGSAQRYLSQ